MESSLNMIDVFSQPNHPLHDGVGGWAWNGWHVDGWYGA